MKSLILIKLGGSVITNKKREFSVREANILRLGREIKSALKSGKCKVIIGHGAGSFAHVPAYKYKTKEGLINRNSLYGMSVTEDAARKLNTIVIKNLLSLGLPVFSFSPASFLISDAQVYSKSYLDPIKKALQIGVIPVVYGDVILDKAIGCTIFSTEKILSILAREFMKDYKVKIIYVTDTDGVYDENGKTIEKITPANFSQVKKAIIVAATTDVTGGMLHKIEESLGLAKRTGIETLVVNGMKAGSLRNAILGA
ncbi:MAG: isopentenyl phosphate kinase, partial [Candidatus Woesebacteria bacterium]|nr:isopentenyl phosphate kinase [Candidatus Woesebacteria bacterium]